MKITEEAYEAAIHVLKSCAKPVGFYASGLAGGYEALWARDSMITSLGASLVGERFKNSFKRSLETLARHQSKHGQIPNAVGSYNVERRSDITFNSIDSTLWYLIGHFAYKEAHKDSSLLIKHAKSVRAALNWLEFQDPNEDGLLVQQPTMDWQDAFPHKYGRTINTQALYYAVLKLMGKKKEAEHLKKVVNGETERYLSLYNLKLGYYHPWVWKTHGPNVRETENWFDTLGNLLAIVTGLATPKIAKSILRYIDRAKINRPYPCKAIFPPIKKGDKEWHDYFEDADSRKPFEYLNAGIWPFIGGFYVAALVKTGMLKKAEKELGSLARANQETIKNKYVREFGFQEWLHGKTGKPIPHSNPYQAWTAGAYVFGFNAVKGKKVEHF